MKLNHHWAPEKARYARALRKNQTEAEEILWQRLRRKTLGVRVRRQFVIWGYIADFYVPAWGLAIEVDGSVHDAPGHAEKDKIRDGHLLCAGVRTIRFRNEQVQDDLEAVVAAIAKAAKL